MSDISQYLKASGQRVNGGKLGIWFNDGKGVLDCTKAPKIGIDSHLLKLEEIVASDLGLVLTINSVDTGQHVPGSRHYDGRATDIDYIELYGADPNPATLANPHAVAFVEHLIACGFVAGHENGPHAAVLFGPVGTKWNATTLDHRGHVHVSVYK
jgi:hypothetical protein